MFVSTRIGSYASTLPLRRSKTSIARHSNTDLALRHVELRRFPSAFARSRAESRSMESGYLDQIPRLKATRVAGHHRSCLTRIRTRALSLRNDPLCSHLARTWKHRDPLIASLLKDALPRQRKTRLPVFAPTKWTLHRFAYRRTTPRLDGQHTNPVAPLDCVTATSMKTPMHLML